MMADDPAVAAVARALSPHRIDAFSEATMEAARTVVAAVRPLVLEEAAQAIEAEADRNPKGIREHLSLAGGNWFDRSSWLRRAARVVRALAGETQA